jgi:hypothetical protein
VSVEQKTELEAIAQGHAEVDIDLGVRKLARLSDGKPYENPRAGIAFPL